MAVTTFFRADKLALCSLFVGKDETRYYLNGVYIEGAGNDGARCVATDGHRMAIFHDEAGFTAAPCIIPLPKAAIDSVRKRKTREFCWFGIIGEHDDPRHECRIFDTTDEASDLAEVRERMLNPKDRGIIWNGAIELIQGEFPEWRSVVPSLASKNGTIAAFNGKLLADFVTVAKDRSKEAPAISICQDAAGAAIITAERPDFVGILMPMRAEQLPLVHDMRNMKVPGWLDSV